MECRGCKSLNQERPGLAIGGFQMIHLIGWTAEESSILNKFILTEFVQVLISTSVPGSAVTLQYLQISAYSETPRPCKLKNHTEVVASITLKWF